MTITATALRELHRIHRQVADLKGRLAQGPRQIKSAQTRVDGYQRKLDEAKEKHKRTRMTNDDKNLQLKQREAKVDDLKAKLNTAASNKEYQTLKDQIAADIQANSVLGDEILELMEKVDLEGELVATAEKELAEANASLAEVKTKVEGETGKLESELGRVLDELEQAESALPIDFKTDYKRVADAKGEEALAPVEGEFCGGCYQSITSQMISELMMSKPVFCKTCGALLYFPEDTSPTG